ncbi:MAG TPA: erythromycin esterase family protein [Kofleriaceae bacterium]|nr:erythromycin esterase family protein [Kofleriaceae bacterium]
MARRAHGLLAWLVMTKLADPILAQAIAEQATAMTGNDADFDPLLERIGDARFVLLGEATHGSHEFYRLRAELTKRLIREKGFTAIATEADWPDAYRIHRYVQGATGHGARDRSAADALGDFQRFPQWMWRNTDILALVDWLRAHNDQVAGPHKVGFYGLDLYSLHASMAAVIGYLERRDPAAAQRARERYACFEVHGAHERGAQRYGRAVALGLAPDCEHEVLQQLVEVLKQRDTQVRRDGLAAEDAQFEGEQNARLVAHAEEYYRAMYLGEESTWNLRDTHMADTLDAIAAHLERRGGGAGKPAKIVVWAHNSHVGDSAAMAHRAERDEITLGHLCRERHGDRPNDVMLVGFTTYTGTVTAASDWGASAERKQVRPALPGSFEALFHEVGVPSFLLLLGQLGEATAALHEPRLERAIGVLYLPESERYSHYFDVRLADQLDAVIHVDETRALEPLERSSQWDRGELPETYPTGL